MTKRPSIPQSRRHIMVYDEDWALLKELFNEDTTSGVGVGTFVKELIRRKCQELRARFADKLDRTPAADQPKVLADLVKAEAQPEPQA